MDIRKLHRKAVESQYDSICFIYEFGKKQDTSGKSKLTMEKEYLAAENIPCRISFSNIPAASENGATVSRQQSVKLFLAPEIMVKAGCKVVVAQNGVVTEYKNSGEPAIYPSHQEINLELFRGWT